MSSTAIFVAPTRKVWQPTLNGKALPPCTLYDKQGASAPKSTNDPTWSRLQIWHTLGSDAELREQIWQSILALWRLKQCMKEGLKDDLWVQHVHAWLNRHSDCCKLAKLELVPVVVDFANEVKMATSAPVKSPAVPPKKGTTSSTAAEDVEMVDVPDTGHKEPVPPQGGRTRPSANRVPEERPRTFVQIPRVQLTLPSTANTTRAEGTTPSPVATGSPSPGPSPVTTSSVLAPNPHSSPNTVATVGLPPTHSFPHICWPPRSSRAGCTECVFLEDFPQYEDLLRDRPHATTSLHLAASHVEATLSREAATLAMLATQIEQRKEPLKDLYLRLVSAASQVDEKKQDDG